MNQNQKPQRSLSRLAAIAGAAVAAAAGSAALGLPAANAATTALPVSLAASSDGASASYNSHGAIILTPGTTTSTTYAEVSVNLNSLGNSLAPTDPPSFTTDNYSAGSPRWVIELANGNWIDGYPSQLGGGAADDFTGTQWQANGTGVTNSHGAYEKYQEALSDAHDTLGNVQVTSAFIVADGDQSAGTTDTLTNVQYDGETAAPGPVCSPATGCSWERLKNPSAMVMDVKGQTPALNAPVIAYGAKAGDPAADFTLTASGTGASKQIAYTPYGTYAAAKQADATLAGKAYNSSTGAPLFCVSSIADKSGQPAELRSCATTANAWQDFLSVGSGSYRELEPTYGQAGVSAGSKPMALNDKGYGGNGTPLVNYAAIASGNEEFTPGT